MEKAFAQIKPGELAQHLHKALGGRFVEPIQLLDLFDAGRVHPLSATVASTTLRRPFATAIAALQLRHHLLHGSTRHKLNHRKGHQQHTEQGGDHQQQTFEHIHQHVSAPPPLDCGWPHWPTTSN